MAIAEPKEEKRIFDAKILESYCKAKYGYKVVNAMGRTKEQEDISLKEQEEKNPSWLHIYKMLPVGEYKPQWQQKYDILFKIGLLEKDLREDRLNDLLDS